MEITLCVALLLIGFVLGYASRAARSRTIIVRKQCGGGLLVSCPFGREIARPLPPSEVCLSSLRCVQWHQPAGTLDDPSRDAKDCGEYRQTARIVGEAVVSAAQLVRQGCANPPRLAERPAWPLHP
jgi:hypothetical protein